MSSYYKEETGIAIIMRCIFNFLMNNFINTKKNIPAVVAVEMAQSIIMKYHKSSVLTELSLVW